MRRFVAEYENAFGHINCFLNIVGNEKHGGCKGLPELDQFILKIVAKFDVQLAIGFIHHQKVRIYRERPGNCNALHHAGGNLIGKKIGSISQAHHVEDII